MAQASTCTGLSIFVNTLGLIEGPHDRTVNYHAMPFDRSEGSVYWLGGLLYESKGPSDLGMLTTGSSGGPRGLTEVFP